MYPRVHEEDKLLAALAGVLMHEIAAEQAGGLDDVKGPGTFVPAFLDRLYNIAQGALGDNFEWLGAANVEMLDVM